MDDTLGEFDFWGICKGIAVLILVLMDNTLGVRIMANVLRMIGVVLILVLMDNTLGDKYNVEFYVLGKSLNPCFNG